MWLDTIASFGQKFWSLMRLINFNRSVVPQLVHGIQYKGYMSKYIPPEEDDLIFFREAMQEVKPIKRSVAVKAVMKKGPRTAQRSKPIALAKEPHKSDKELFFSLSDPLEQTVLAEATLFFRRQGPQVNVIKQLMRGEMRRSACLDLHGMTVEQARLAVIAFLRASQKARFRCVQIIHGKGQVSPKLKNYINYWLPQFPGVLAFTSAKARDGGNGAVYILLAKEKGG